MKNNNVYILEKNSKFLNFFNLFILKHTILFWKFINIYEKFFPLIQIRGQTYRLFLIIIKWKIYFAFNKNYVNILPQKYNSEYISLFKKIKLLLITVNH
jgi:hypothetical protein